MRGSPERWMQSTDDGGGAADCGAGHVEDGLSGGVCVLGWEECRWLRVVMWVEAGLSLLKGGRAEGGKGGRGLDNASRGLR